MQKIIIANWKMNQNLASMQDWFSYYQENAYTFDKILAGIAVPFVYIPFALAQIKQTKLPFQIGAQNLYSSEKGAYTGEISANMLADIACQFVLIGHSERRQLFLENADMLSQKIQQALVNHVQVVYCVGEPLSIREAGGAETYVATQIQEVLHQIEPANWKNISIAYEPIWAIGTGKIPSANEIKTMHAHIRYTVQNMQTLHQVPILYGGSCQGDNAASILSIPCVDGALVGGASLKADSFFQILKIANGLPSLSL
jgi:triosephosphate isomerase